MRHEQLIVCSILLTAVGYGASPLHSRHATALPPMFEENRGQFPDATKYLTRRQGYQVSFEPGVARIFAGQGDPVQLAFPGADVPQGADPMLTKLNYFQGNDSRKWVQGAEAYRRIAYQGAGGESLVFYWNAAGELEFDLTLPAGNVDSGCDRGVASGRGRPPQVGCNAAFGFRLSGETEARISSEGDLIIGALTMRKPVVYQVVAGVRRVIRCQYVFGDDGLIGFELGDYNRNLAVTIDPTLSVTAGTYLGGSYADNGRAVAVDSSGNVYIAGDTTSPDFPLTSPLQSSFNGNDDAFIAKLNASGSSVIFATYLGGSTQDKATGIGLDSSGNIYVAGTTHSSDFPLKNPIIGTFHSAAGYTGFVAKLNSTGSQLMYSTYLGGTGAETINGLAADSAGNAYVTGGTLSIDFPILNGYQTVSQNPPGFDQPFLTKLSTGGTLSYSTISNAFGSDGYAVAADNSGIAVFTNGCNEAGAPVLNAFQSQPAGGIDAYIVKVNTNLTGAASLLFATFLGGSGVDEPTSIALDTSDNVYVAGTTASGNFPLMNAYQITPSHSFVTKLASSGSSLMFSTYFGGVSTYVEGIATDASGNVYATGFDFNSPTFPQVNALAGQTNPGFVAALSFSGSLIYSSYVGQGLVTPAAIAASAGGNVTLTGQSSGTLPVTANAVQPSPNSSNAFVLTLQFATPAVLTTTSVTPNQGGDSGFTTVSVQGVNIQSAASLSLQSASSTLVAFSSSVSVDSRGITGTFDLRHQPDGVYNVVVTNPDSTTATLPNAFTVSLGGAPQLYANVVGSTTVTATRENLINLEVAGARTVSVIIGNNGTADAFEVPVTVKIGPGVNYTLQNTLVPPAQNAGAAVIDYSQVPISASDGTNTYVGLMVPWIPAGGTSHFMLTLTAPVSTPNGFSTTLSVTVDNPYLMVNPNGSQITGTAVRRSLFQPRITAGQLALNLIQTAAGRVCVWNIIQLALQALNIVPGAKCGQDLLEPLVVTALANAAAAGVQAGLNGGSLDAGDQQSAIVQNDVSAVQIVADCAGAAIPLRNIVAAVQTALATVGALDSCTKFIVQCIMQIVASSDPNEKDGPPGAGGPLWISGTTPAPYGIQFENLPTATAPAGKVVVTDQLNPQLVNLSTFSFGAIGFGSTSLAPTPGSKSYSSTVDLRPAQNVLVSVNASISNTGLITWIFQSLDPGTGMPITDPEQGFLPPNTMPPNGQGYVYFTAQLNPGLTTGTGIPNQANVVFDNNAAILTNVWQNTIDATPPVSHATALPSNEASNVFTVNWSGTDVGSGVQNFTVFNSVNGGPFTPWITSTTGASASCVAAPNSTQAFFTIATDAAGNVEAGKVSAETSTQVANVLSVSINTTPPGLQVSVDNGTAQASPISAVWQAGSQHTIATTTPQTSGGTQNNFTGWSDSGALSHLVTATAGTTSYTASFNTSYALTVFVNPSPGGSVGVSPPPTNGYYPPGTVVTLTATPNTGYGFTSWTGNVASNSSASTTVTMSQPQSVTANFSSLASGPVDVSSQVKVTGTGLVFSRATNTYSGTVTITNISSTAIATPIQSVFTSLISGATLTNATGIVPSGTYAGSPYITAAGSSPLAPGASVSITVKFTYTGTAAISYVSKTLSGGF